MNKRIKIYIKQAHLWLGMISGVIVFILAFTGALYVFAEDIKSYTHKDRHIINIPSGNPQRIQLDSILVIAKNAVEKPKTFSHIVVPQESDHAISVLFQQINDEAFGYPNYVEYQKTVFINPYTGKVTFKESSKWEFFNIVLSVHMTLFMGHNSISHAIVTYSVWIFVIMLITGLILWWPKKSQHKQSFKFKWKSSTRWRRKNYDLHRILGFYFFSIALISALTGLMWASKSFNTTVKWVANGGQLIKEAELPLPKTDKISATPFQDIYTKTIQLVPETKYFFLRKHPKDAVPYIVRSYVNESLNYTRVEMYYDRETATLLNKRVFADKNSGEKIQTLNYDIHVGTIGGWPTKIITFLMSLVVASLPITGTVIWWGRKQKKPSSGESG